MEWASKESLSLLYFLLPGLVAAWVFYGLTAHPKREAFERVVQALIFTVIIQAIVYIVKFGLLAIGDHFFAIGEWTTESALIWSVVVALVNDSQKAFCKSVVEKLVNTGHPLSGTALAKQISQREPDGDIKQLLGILGKAKVLVSNHTHNGRKGYWLYETVPTTI